MVVEGLLKKGMNSLLDALESSYVNYQDIEEQYEQETYSPVQQEQLQLNPHYVIHNQCSEEKLFSNITGHENLKTVLLNLMETNMLSSTKIKDSITLLMQGIKIFATCNDMEKIVKPLQSRFLTLLMKDYSYDEFLEIFANLLSKYKHDELTARRIAYSIWNDLGSKDIRDVIKAGRIIKSAEDIPWYVSTLKEYSKT